MDYAICIFIGLLMGVLSVKLSLWEEKQKEAIYRARIKKIMKESFGDYQGAKMQNLKKLHFSMWERFGSEFFLRFLETSTKDYTCPRPTYKHNIK